MCFWPVRVRADPGRRHASALLGGPWPPTCRSRLLGVDLGRGQQLSDGHAQRSGSGAIGGSRGLFRAPDF